MQILKKYNVIIIINIDKVMYNNEQCQKILLKIWKTDIGPQPLFPKTRHDIGNKELNVDLDRLNLEVLYIVLYI